MGCPFCLCNGKEGEIVSGDFKLSIDFGFQGQPVLRIERKWFDSDGSKRFAESFLPIEFCPMCGERLTDVDDANDSVLLSTYRAAAYAMDGMDEGDMVEAGCPTGKRWQKRIRDTSFEMLSAGYKIMAFKED